MTRHRSPRVRDFWHLLMDMQSLVERNIRPHAAAVRLAREHWRMMPCKTYDSTIQWFKRNQRLFLDDLRSTTWEEQVHRMWERMEEENRREIEQWLKEHGTTSGIAMVELERMFEERDRENPRWRVQWRERCDRDPEDMLAFFRASFTEPEEADEEVDEHPLAERKGFLRDPVDF